MLQNLIQYFLMCLVVFIYLGCGSDRAGETIQQGVGGVVETIQDTDGDGIYDTIDADVNGDGINDNGIDSDGDGIVDIADVDINGDGILDNGLDNDGDGINNQYDIDDDNDGLSDSQDPNDNNHDTDGDGISDSVDVDINGDGTNDNGIDSDGDGINDSADVDVNGDGTNDNGIDSDGDGINDSKDSIDNNQDNDNDGLADSIDPNDNNNDSDGDGISDGVDADVNGDGQNDNGTDSDSDGMNNLTDNDDDNDGVSDSNDVNSTNPDSDNDGIPDGADVDMNGDGTNDNSIDSDGDGIIDSADADANGDGIIDNGTDSDGDGINDALDIDDDNDGLSDTSEIHLGTNRFSADSDGDGIGDLAEGIQDRDSDGTIDALESNTIDSDSDGVTNQADSNNTNPNNDSDNDGQVNIKETECNTIGDPLDPTKRCPYIFETSTGEALKSAGFVYVPGGFDVDGDGTPEKGFCTTSYQARGTGNEIASSDIIAIVKNFDVFIDKYFSVANSELSIQGYTNNYLTDTLKGESLSFLGSNLNSTSRISSLTPYLALASLEYLEIRDSNNTLVTETFTLPSHKQYVQLQKLLLADRNNGGDGETVRSNILGIDKEVPLNGYFDKVYEVGSDTKEYLSELLWLVDSNNTTRFDLDNLQTWWEVDSDVLRYHHTPEYGANSTLDVGMGIGIYKDHYAVVVRGGSLLYLLQGVTGIESDLPNTTSGIGFRAATGYLP